MAQPRVLVLTGYGINCDDETSFAFEKAGARPEIVHVNDLIDNPQRLSNYQIFAIPGGFSWGDDTGAGIALANKMRARLHDGLQRFVDDEKLIIGICNGFQGLDNLGLVPALGGNYFDRQAALVANDFPRYNARWVDLQFRGTSPWTAGVGIISIPIAHGEGKFYAEPGVLQRMKEKGMIAARYVNGRICKAQKLPYNPNGSLDDVAAATDETGRVLGIMPHPERVIDFTQLPDWTDFAYEMRLRGEEIPEEGPGLAIFRNGVNYFK